jgi:hypothetical protein
MPPEYGQAIDTLPLIPEAVLKKHHCQEPLDNRFRAAARLLQSIWREDRGLPMGAYTSQSGQRRKLGSRISDGAGKAGGNFLNADIARIAWREAAYREIGAMIDEERLYTNLLSSMPLCYNLFAPLKQDLVQATTVLHELIPGFEGTATQVVFEHSPGRGQAQFTEDYTAFDVLIRYLTSAGKRGFAAFEVKYSESMREPSARMRPRYDALSESSGLFLDHANPSLRDNPYQQLWREHMLAQAMIDAGQYDEGCYVLIAPGHNFLVQEAAEGYLGLLAEAAADKARFYSLTLEQVIDAIRLCDAEHAEALYRRYCDWWLVDGEIELCAPKFGKKKSASAAAAIAPPESSEATKKNLGSPPVAAPPALPSLEAPF